MPIIATFLVDPTLFGLFRLDGIVITVDACTAPARATLEQQEESVKQIAVADRILLTDPNGGSPIVLASTQYHYEDSRFAHLLTGITGARGERYATWVYDGDGRVIASEHDGVDDFSFAYASPNSTTRTRTVTNALGREEVFTFTQSNAIWLLQDIDQPSTANVPASNASFTYADKIIATETDEEGRATTYVRDSLGLPTSIKEATSTMDERTSTFAWRSDRQLDLAVTPGLTRDYGYDVEGLLASIVEEDTTSHSLPYATNGETREWAFTYTTEGLLASVDGPLSGTGDTISYTYDADGYLETVTNELGHVTTVLSVEAMSAWSRSNCS